MKTEDKKMEIIDRKFKFVATNPCKGNVYTEENAIVFCAKDKAVPEMLRAYYDECEKIGAEEEHLESVWLLCQRVIDFQTRHGSKVPDTETLCEINRCIKGKLGDQ